MTPRLRRPARPLGAALVILLALAALHHDAEARGAMVAGRALHVHVPPGYTGSAPVPLVILLHGVGVTGTFQDVYLRIAEQSDLRGFLYVYPDGLRGPLGPFWNGAACCQDAYTPPVDDVAYIDAIIDYVRDHYRLDERRVFIIGHSNGAYMTSRYACESGRAAAVVTLGGGQYLDPLQCGARPWFPFWGPAMTSVLHVHGTNDEITPYWWSWTMALPMGGGTLPSAPQTIASWMYRNGCVPAGGDSPIDLDANIAGAETTRSYYACVGPALEFWTMNGSPHCPMFFQSPSSATFGARAIDWLYAHGR
jgi:polyhydroxybutyrate depolymerase